MAHKTKHLVCVLLLSFILGPVVVLAIGNRPSKSLSATLETQVGLNLNEETANTLFDFSTGMEASNMNTVVPQHIVLDYSSRPCAKEANAILEAMSQEKHSIFTLTVEGYGSLANWTQLAEVISRAQRIDALHWHSNAIIPSVLLSALEQHQSHCRIYYTIPFSNWDPFDDSVPPAQPVGQEASHKMRAAERASIVNS